jgi:ABC-type polar amino acid transport system ATPase subunit
VANRVLFMDDGLIVEQGEPAAVLNEPKTERLRQFLRQIVPRNGA